MAVLIPAAAAVVGGTMGGAVAAGAGLTGLAASAAAGIGSTIVGAAVSGGLDEFFSDPAKALTSIAMGTFMPYATKGVMSGFNSVKEMVMANGISASAEASGNIYTGISSAMDNGMSELISAQGGLSNAMTSSGELAASDTFSAMNDMSFDLHKAAGEDMFAQTNAMNIKQTPDFLPLDETPSLSEGSDMYGVAEKSSLQYKEGEELFGMLEQGVGEGSFDLPSLDIGLTPQLSSAPLQPMAPDINQDTGSIENVSGLAGIFGDDDLYNNPVVKPMVDAYKRQQDKANRLAQSTWGLLNVTRTKGLMA